MDRFIISIIISIIIIGIGCIGAFPSDRWIDSSASIASGHLHLQH
jgi:hypothetical protein